MATKPVKLPEWATDPGADVVEPSVGQKGDGWDVSDRPPAGWLNWLQELTYDWLNWVDTVFDDGSAGNIVAVAGLESTATETNGTGVKGVGKDFGSGGRFESGITAGAVGLSGHAMADNTAGILGTGGIDLNFCPGGVYSGSSHDTAPGDGIQIEGGFAKSASFAGGDGAVCKGGRPDSLGNGIGGRAVVGTGGWGYGTGKGGLAGAFTGGVPQGTGAGGDAIDATGADGAGTSDGGDAVIAEGGAPGSGAANGSSMLAKHRINFDKGVDTYQNPTIGTGLKNDLRAALVVKAWCAASLGATPAFEGGCNFSGIALGATNVIRFSYAAVMESNVEQAIVVTVKTEPTLRAGCRYHCVPWGTGNGFDLHARDFSGATVDLQNTLYDFTVVSVIVMAQQTTAP